jgi:hypothetical protein
MQGSSRLLGLAVKHFFSMGFAIFENLGSNDHAFSQAWAVEGAKGKEK